jgi:acyl-CoA synthetase (AMP-forming)/AMP-acid ligase II
MRLGFEGRRVDAPVFDLRLDEALDAAAQRHPERIGWVFERTRCSLAHMRDGSWEVARALQACGVRRGDVVAVWMANLPAFALLQFACARIGALIAAVHLRASVPEVQHFLADSGARLLVVGGGDAAPRSADAWVQDLPAAAWRGAGRLHHDELPGLQTVVGAGPQAGTLAWQAFLARAEDVTRADVQGRSVGIGPDDPLLVQYTSGTTSRPKGALCSHRYVLNFGTAILHRMGVEEGDAFLNTQPFFHVGGSCGAIPAPLTVGCMVVTPTTYDPGEVLRLIERERCVARSGYGAMYLKELEHPQLRHHDLSSLKGGWCVGPPELLERVRREMGIEGLVQIYGSTEAGGTAGWVDDPWSVRSTTCGPAVAGTEISIRQPDSGEPLPEGEVGEAWIRGWWQYSGYLNGPPVPPGSWVRSGDLARLGPGGHLQFAGRLKDMLKVGGENVSAAEVEAVLLEHPGIVQAAVIGAPDARLGEVVLAVVERRSGAPLSDEDVIAHCRGRLAGFRVPRHVRWTTDWPLTDSGKVMKGELRARYRAQSA